MYLNLLLIGCGSLGAGWDFSLVVPLRAAPSFPRTGRLWPSELTSPRRDTLVACSTRGTDVFKAVVAPVGASLGTGRSRVSASGWAAMDVNLDDPVEVALAARV